MEPVPDIVLGQALQRPYGSQDTRQIVAICDPALVHQMIAQSKVAGSKKSISVVNQWRACQILTCDLAFGGKHFSGLRPSLQ